jgi:hypothetical protein
MEAAKFQSSRYEFKYLIDEQTAREVRQFVVIYLEPDAHTDGNDNLGYAVHSLYLDSPDLKLCRATLDGVKNRFKLRIRFYDELPTTPVFFETKRRVNNVILKERAAVRRSSVPRLLEGGWPELDDLLWHDEKNWMALEYFCRLRDVTGAVPSAYTSYFREGFEPADSNIWRVTFDRWLRAGEYRDRLSVADLETWSRPQVDGVILELKFTDTFPNWMETLVESFDLTRVSMPKYVKCVSLVRHGWKPLTLPEPAAEPVVLAKLGQRELLCA